jgi:di/tricarboxylate transporter
MPMPLRLRQLGQTARVLRIVKLLRKAKQVQVIMGALSAGGRSILVIFLLLVLAWIFYGTVGTIYLGANDHFHFQVREIKVTRPLIPPTPSLAPSELPHQFYHPVHAHHAE